MTRTRYSISAAARITGRGRATLRKMMGAGDLSFEVNDRGHRVIEASELLRVFDDECDFGAETAKKPSKKKTQRSESDEGTRSVVDRRLHEELINQYKSQVEDLREALGKAQEGQNRVTLLLEDHSKQQSEWQRRFMDLEKIASSQQQETEKMAELEVRVSKLTRALKAEQDKGFWKRLRGK